MPRKLSGNSLAVSENAPRKFSGNSLVVSENTLVYIIHTESIYSDEVYALVQQCKLSYVSKLRRRADADAVGYVASYVASARAPNNY